jgi:hypothetical protein
MVTKPNTDVPPTNTALKPMKPITPATVASGQSNGLTSRPNNQGNDTAKFTLPEKLTTAEVKDNSFKYGGGRSAGGK